MVPKKRDNTSILTKLALRRYFLRRYPSADLAGYRVLDCCGGREAIWGRLRREFPVAEYLSLDLAKREGRLRMDSARFLAGRGKREREPMPFDVVDIDSYGSPWRHWRALLTRAPRDITIFLTYGRVPFGGLSKDVLQAMGIRGLGRIPLGMMGGLKELSIPYLLAQAGPWGWRIERAAQGQDSKSASYIGVRLGVAGKSDIEIVKD